MSKRSLAFAATILFPVAGCALPNFVSSPDSTNIAPSGPKIAALIANLKCEIWEAANDDEHVLPYYNDTPSLTERDFSNRPKDRQFTLKNLFEEIDFIAEAQFTLDVTGAGAFNPSISYVLMPYKSAGTNLTLSVGGQLSDTAHRNLILYSSVEGERLVASEPSQLYAQHGINLISETPVARVDPTRDPVPCNSGKELGGSLGLREVIASALIAERMNDVAVFQNTSGSGTVNGAPAPSSFSSYAFGQFSTQVDFTVIEGVNGGPNWNLVHFKGPGGGSQGLLNASRQVKDTLVMTFLAVCVRDKYFPKAWENPPKPPKPSLSDITKTTVVDKTSSGVKTHEVINKSSRIGTVTETNTLPISYPVEYEPEMGVGTPGWVNYLPPCNSPQGQQAKATAPARARLNDLSIQGLGILQQLEAQ